MASMIPAIATMIAAIIAIATPNETPNAVAIPWMAGMMIPTRALPNLKRSEINLRIIGSFYLI